MRHWNSIIIKKIIQVLKKVLIIYSRQMIKKGVISTSQENMQSKDVLYTVPEVAELLKTNVEYVYRLQKAGLLRFMKIGRYKCRKSTLEEFLEKYDGMDISDPFNIKKIETEGVEEDGNS